MQIIIRIIADGLLVPVVLIAVYLLIFRVKNSQKLEVYSRILLAGLTAFLMAKFMSVLVQHPTERPFELLGVAAGASFLPNPGFPSDHALFGMAIFYAVWFETRLRLWSAVVLALVALVCLGRVLALVHTPLDIVGGIAAATFGALWYLTVSHGRKRQV